STLAQFDVVLDTAAINDAQDQSRAPDAAPYGPPYGPLSTTFRSAPVNVPFRFRDIGYNYGDGRVNIPMRVGEREVALMLVTVQVGYRLPGSRDRSGIDGTVDWS